MCINKISYLLKLAQLILSGMNNCARKPGAPAKCHENHRSIIIAEKDKLVKIDTIISKCDKMWKVLTDKWNIRNSTLYSYAVNNKFGLKNAQFDIIESKSDTELSDMNDSVRNLSFNSPIEFSFWIKKKKNLRIS